MKTLEFSATFGFVPGYDHDNATEEQMDETLNGFIMAWRHYAEIAEKLHGVYATCVIYPTKTIYKTEWGCPLDGENTITAEGAFNPLLAAEYHNAATYRSAVEFIVRNMKDHLKQTTVRVIFREVEQTYYKY